MFDRRRIHRHPKEPRTHLWTSDPEALRAPEPWHDHPVPDRVAKDETTLVIARALLVFAATWVVGLAALVVIHRTTDLLPGDDAGRSTWILLVVAVALSGTVLGRTRRP